MVPPNYAQAPQPSQLDPKKLTPEQSAELTEAARLNNQVVDLYKQGKCDEALPLARRVVETMERIHGENNARTASALINVAELHRAKGNHSEAKRLYERALSIYEKLFGLDHLNNAIIVESLALINYLRGDYKNSETLYLRALSIRERGFGAEHPEVAQIVYKVAEFYRSRREYQKAEPLFLRAIAIEDKTIAKDQPAPTQIVERYVCFLYESKGFAEARKQISAFYEARREKSRPLLSAAKGQVLNGTALSLPAPAYPAEARSIRASGVVLVQVTIDTNGKVIDAKAVCGHPVFAKPSLAAAYKARFTQTKLSGKPVQVNGVIIYNFVAP